MLAGTLVTGLSLGSMYALLALGFHITFMVSRTVNFAQGSAMMFAAVVAYTLCITFSWPWLLAAAATLLACAIYGLAIERFLVRPFVSRGSEAWLMATVAGGLLMDNATLFTFGKEPRRFVLELAEQRLEIFGAGVNAMQLVIPLAVVVVVLALFVVRRFTRIGKMLDATVQNPQAASLMGIRVKRVIAASYAVSTVFAGIAGLLIAPLISVHADMGTLFGLKAFAVAILGGMGSAGGIVAAGLIFGLVEALITLQAGSGFTQIITFGLVIVALAVRPNGLFGKAALKKV